MHELERLVIASQAFELSQLGKEKIGMHAVTLHSFLDELEKIALDAAMMARVGEKALKRGWSGARETKSLARLAKAEGRGAGRVMNPHVLDTGMPHVAKPAPSPTVVQRANAGTVAGRAPAAPKPAPAAPAAQAVPNAAPQPGARPAGGSPLMKRLAIGGGLVAGGAMADHMMTNRQQRAA